MLLKLLRKIQGYEKKGGNKLFANGINTDLMCEPPSRSFKQIMSNGT